MEKFLSGKRIAIGGSRKLDEISLLIEKQGGEPLVRSLQGTVFLAEKEVESDLVEFIDHGADWVIFTTGVGIDTLLTIADKLGHQEAFLNRLHEANIASRGYKSLNVLKRLNIQPAALDQDGTTKGLVQALEGVDFTGKRAMLQLHGEDAPILTRFLEERGASVQKILPYQHIRPETDKVAALCDELLSHQVDAVCFTTATQVRFLFEFAREKGMVESIRQAFANQTVATSVGKVTTEALRDEGVKRIVAPELERMGAMVIALSKYYQA